MTSDLTLSSAEIESLGVARIYAEASWQAAEKQGIADDLVEEIESLVADVLDPNPKLEQLFQLAGVDRDGRRAMVERIFAGRISDALYRLLDILARRDRLRLIRGIAYLLRKYLEVKHNRTAVFVRSAIALDESAKGELLSLLTGKLGYEPTMVEEVRPEVLGGLWLRIGETVYDRTVLSNLKRIRDNILARSSHEN